MSAFTEEYNSVFFISLATLLIGAFGVGLKFCLKSKCENISLCCGLIKVKRNVELETELEEKELELGITEEKENKV